MRTVSPAPERLPHQLRHWAQTRAGEIALQQKDYGIWEPVTGRSTSSRRAGSAWAW